MIRALTVTNPKQTVIPWWGDVPFLKRKKRIEFPPGITLLFGPNGSGKSTIIATLAKTLCAWQGGVSKLTEASMREFHKLDVGKSDNGQILDGAVPEHDGRGVLFLDPTKAPGTSVHHGIDQDFGFAQIQDHFNTRASAGQITVSRMNDVFAALQEPELIPKPDLDFVKRRSGTLNDMWTPVMKRLAEVTRGDKGKRKSGVPTLLLDEPDRSLSIPWAANMWLNIAERHGASKEVQIIAATHCPFALDLPNVNYIETEPGYLDQCRRVMQQVGVRWK